jgi:SWI/SNF-related matrix-associated actin-dependent regulator of chromatin subfamily A3
MIEEQALCRLHQVGQKRRVTTIRYLMRGSFEEVSSFAHDIMNIIATSAQGNKKLILHSKLWKSRLRKKKLAEVTSGSEQMSEEGIGLGTLLASHVSCNPETKLIVIQYLKSVLE